MKNETKKLGWLEGWISIVLNTALFFIKFWVGAASGSIAMVADAWHTLSDTLTSIVLLVGFWMAGRKPDRQHPYGHGRAEVISSVIIGTLLGVVGVNFLTESCRRLSHEQSARFGVVAIVVFLVSVVLKEALAQFSLWAGRKTGSNSLKADGWHHRSDAIASALIVLGAFAGKKIWWIDGVMGIAVSALILYAAYEIIRSGSGILLGEALPPDLEANILKIIQSTTPSVKGIHHFHSHCYGEHREITFHIRLPPQTALSEAHACATSIEKAIRDELAIESTIHLEPMGSVREGVA